MALGCSCLYKHINTAVLQAAEMELLTGRYIAPDHSRGSCVMKFICSIGIRLQATRDLELDTILEHRCLALNLQHELLGHKQRSNATRP